MSKVYLLIYGVEYEFERVCGVLSDKDAAITWMDEQKLDSRDAYCEVNEFAMDVPNADCVVIAIRNNRG